MSPASSGDAPKPRPEYLKNISFGIDEGDRPSMVGAISAITTDRLRVSVDYSLYRNGWMQIIRAPIGEIKEPVKGQRVGIALITTAANRPGAGSNDLWWGDPV